MTNSQTHHNEDEIDLRELWASLIKRKVMMTIITAIITISASIYAWTSPPIYQGVVLIEIGQLILNGDPSNNKPTMVQLIDNPSDLIQVILHTFGNGKATIDMPKNTNSLIQVSYEDTRVKTIQRKLEEIVRFSLNRHQERSNFYAKVGAKISPSALISTININPDPIKPKKLLIVTIAFISGLILSLFLALILEFIQTAKNKRTDAKTTL